MDVASERELVERRRSGDDLAQDVFPRIYRRLTYFRGDARLSNWIYGMVANVCSEQHGMTAPGDDARAFAGMAL